MLIDTKSGGQFEASAKWFAFQRKIISEVYGEFKDIHSFKIYLYLCRHYDSDISVVRKNKAKINKELQYVKVVKGKHKYSAKVRNSLNWLEQNGFIERVSSHKQKWYRSKIRVAPDYNFKTKQFMPCDEFTFDLKELKEHMHGYIMIPFDAIKKQSMLANTSLAKRNWTKRKLQAFLLLYGYCWLEFYGGIDPDTVQIDSQGNITLSPRFCYALKSSLKDATKTIVSLIKDGKFKPVECWFEDGVYMGDIGTYKPKRKSNTVKRIVLRPQHLISHKLNSKAMQLKRGRVRL
jgi:hypothetical protein